MTTLMIVVLHAFRSLICCLIVTLVPVLTVGSSDHVFLTIKAGEMMPEVGGGGLGLGGPQGKGSPSVSKGPKPPIQLLQLLKKQSKRSKRVHVHYILGPPPGPTQEMELMGHGALRGRSLLVPQPAPGFFSHAYHH